MPFIRPFSCLLPALLMILIPARTAVAQDTGPPPHAADLTRWIGLRPSDALEQLGAPQNIFVQRGRSADEDNAVFYYPDHLYLFWFQDRVWQVRVDDRRTGDIDGVRMGMKRSEIIDRWGPPINDRDVNPTWTLPDRGYPMRIRLYFDDADRMVDLYVFRSDW